MRARLARSVFLSVIRLCALFLTKSFELSIGLLASYVFLFSYTAPCTHFTGCFAILMVISQGNLSVIGHKLRAFNFKVIGKLRKSQISATSQKIAHRKILTNSHLSVTCKRHPFLLDVKGRNSTFITKY